jgi:hypothetical protein
LLRVHAGAKLPGVLAALVLSALQGVPAVVRPVHVPDRATCAECGISTSADARIGDEDGDGMLSDYPDVVVRLADGRFVVAGRSGFESRPRVFTMRGRFERHLGTIGSGPGEFRSVRASAWFGDSLVLFDDAIGRMTVLSPTLAYARSIPFTPTLRTRAVGVRDGFAAAALIEGGGLLPYAVHLFDRDGAHLRPAGDSADDVIGWRGYPRAYTVGPASGGGFWTAPRLGDYVLRRFDGSGRLRQSLVVHSAWYDGSRDSRGITPSRPPQSSINHVWQGADGLLWVIGTTADPRWREGIGPPMLTEGQMISPVNDQVRVYDAIIEVIDPVAGRVLTRLRVDRLRFVVQLDATHIAQFEEEGPDGYPILQVYSLRLRRPD